MHNSFNNKFKKNMITIHPGEFYTTDKDIIIHTILGSCISVALYSATEKLAGLNHFMLPVFKNETKLEEQLAGKYGMYAMELLIGEFVKANIPRNTWRAKVFGGSNVLASISSNIGQANIEFITTFLKKEKIPVISTHLGGDKARKILFLTESKKILLKEIEQNHFKSDIREEYEYEEKLEKTIKKEESKESKIILFD